PGLTDGALEVRAGEILVDALCRRRIAGIALAVDAVAEAQRLRPDARVDVADDDVLAGLPDAAELIPQTARSRQAEERRGRRGVHRLDPLLRDRDDVRVGGEPVRLARGQASGEAVERDGVVVELRAAVRLELGVVLRDEV